MSNREIDTMDKQTFRQRMQQGAADTSDQSSPASRSVFLDVALLLDAWIKGEADKDQVLDILEAKASMYATLYREVLDFVQEQEEESA